MKKNNLRNNQTLINKLTQARFVYNAETGIATEIVAEGQTPSTVTINAGNAVCFAVIDDPNWDEYSFADGILTANGVPVQTGSIQVTGILATGKDKVLLTVEPKPVEGEQPELVGTPQDLFIYIPSLDKFKKLMGNVILKDTIEDTDAVKAWTFETRVKKTRKVDQVQPDGITLKVDEEYFVFVQAGIITWNVEASKLGWVTIARPVGTVVASQPGTAKAYAEDGTVEKETSFTEYVFVSDETIKGGCSDEDEYDDDYDEYDEDEDDEYDDDYDDCGCEAEIIKAEKPVVSIISISDRGYIKAIGTLAVNGTFEAYARAGRSSVVKTDKEILVNGNVLTNNVFAVAMLKGYNYLVKTDVKKDGSRVIVFANDNYETKSVVIEQTEDRGEIVTEA